VNLVELSCDLGEAHSPDAIAIEEAIWPLIDAANVACGGHAGDERSMRDAARKCAAQGIILGAHPSYPDRPNFGRVSIDMNYEALVESLVQQIGALREIASAEGARLQRVKAHGALYNDAHANAGRARAIVDAVQRVDRTMAVVAADLSQTAAVARQRGVAVVRESFADRRYMPDGSLVSRKDLDALLSVRDAAEQARMLAEASAVVARDGRRVTVVFETLCIHADMERAVERLRAIRAALGRVATPGTAVRP
jgi:5-oxoprolinase (ATP-hydrolysing) subunit A